MPTVWEPAARESLLARARALTPQHTPKWGHFTVQAMVAHLNDALRMATGDLAVSENPKVPGFLKWPPVRYLVIHHLPMPKSAPTAPELLVGTTADLSQEQHTLTALFDDLPRRPLAATHPVFGPLTRDDWGALIHKHTDHHLRQFGV